MFIHSWCVQCTVMSCHARQYWFNSRNHWRTCFGMCWGSFSGERGCQRNTDCCVATMKFKLHVNSEQVAKCYIRIGRFDAFYQYQVLLASWTIRACLHEQPLRLHLSCSSRYDPFRLGTWLSETASLHSHVSSCHPFHLFPQGRATPVINWFIIPIIYRYNPHKP